MIERTMRHAGWLPVWLAIALLGGCTASPPAPQSDQSPTVTGPRSPAGPGSPAQGNVPDRPRDAPLTSLRIVSLTTRTNVSQRFLLIPPDQGQPIAALILLPGSDGRIQLRQRAGIPSVGRLQSNFLVRTREDFGRRGYAVALFDAPTDRQRPGGMRYGFRESPEHRRDLQAVIAYLKGRFGVPVWVIGTSRGSESAAQAAIALGDQIQGVVLSSSVSVSNGKGSAITELPLERIRVPVLLLAHENDTCRVTPPENISEIRKRLTGSTTVEVHLIFGGPRPEANPCEGRSPHGYLGVEEQAVDAIAAFIGAHNQGTALGTGVVH